MTSIVEPESCTPPAAAKVCVSNAIPLSHCPECGKHIGRAMAVDVICPRNGGRL